MDLDEALRTTGAVREFEDRDVPDGLVHAVLDAARFAPSGGNRQGWRVIVVKDAASRAALRDLYLSGWYEYLAIVSAGLVPWAPVTNREAEAAAIADAPGFAEAGAAAPGFAEMLDTAPALLLVLADLSALAAVDRDLPRYTLAGGASIYPFVWSLLLAARTGPGRRPDDDAGAPRRGRARALRHPRHRRRCLLGGARPPGVGPTPVEAGTGRVVLLGRPLRRSPARRHPGRESVTRP